MDINSQDFSTNFKISDAIVGCVGYGFIGNACVELFREHCTVAVYDKAGYEGKPRYGNVFLFDSIDDVVNAAEVIFVAVPTPMLPSGECCTRIVESVLQDIQNSALRVSRDIKSFIVVIKSTVPPGFTDTMSSKFSLRLVFSPEFLTEANAVEDFKKSTRIILGGLKEDANVVFKYFEGVWPNRMTGQDAVKIIQCKSSVAEMVKLSTNVHLTARVMISNEIYMICQKLGIPYDLVKLLTQLDKRIGNSHMNVPGPDGDVGYGGHCFVKDNMSMAFISEQLGCSDQNEFESLFRSINSRNNQIRNYRDWESQQGRAVIDQ